MIKSLNTNYHSQKENVEFHFEANDEDSGILEYIYIMNQQEFRTNEGSFVVPKIDDSFSIKFIDKAGKVLKVDELYYKKKQWKN